MGRLDFLHQAELPHRAKLVYIYLYDRMDKERRAWLRINTIAKDPSVLSFVKISYCPPRGKSTQMLNFGAVQFEPSGTSRLKREHSREKNNNWRLEIISKMKSKKCCW